MASLREIWAFLRQHKRYWLPPMVSVFVLFGLLLAAGRSSIGTFVYPLF